MKNACKERAKKVKKCLSKTIYLNQNLIKDIKGCVMNFSGLEKIFSNNLREKKVA